MRLKPCSVTPQLRYHDSEGGALKSIVRISWLIAGTLLVCRIAESVVDGLLRHLMGTSLRLPRAPFSFIQYLNAAALLAVSFAIVATCGQSIERRLGRTTRN
jgi:hypothetical protein